MEVGYRIIRRSDVESHDCRLAQISLWSKAAWDVSDGDQAVRDAIAIAKLCREKGIRTVYHPLEYPLIGQAAPRTMEVLHTLAGHADLGIIVHDEGHRGQARLSEEESFEYEKNIIEISRRCPVSIENSFNSADSLWFWERFAAGAPDSVSLTVDIGHLELAGLDSTVFLRNFPPHLLSRIRFVHMHHYDLSDPHPVKDHKPLVPGAREIEALRALLSKKEDLFVIVELDAAEEGMGTSIDLLRELL